LERVIHSPEAHIPIACVTAESGVIYLRFKKSREKVFETMTLDQFIYLIVLALNNEFPNDYFSRFFG